eukprot:Nitzschia sp. Nitz4//scaffold77_size91520//18757//21879//NITZ4_004881-RA/size91520-processed-gene-0.25-mRNA-1//1//CDS//3329557964//4206//frame0
MGTPTVIEVDVNSSMPVSPLTHMPNTSKRRDVVPPSTRSRRLAIEKKNFQEMRSKYSEAKHLMDEMKQESELNKQKLEEMSSVISALQSVAIDYDHDDSDTTASHVLNVERKIRAMDDQLKSAVMQCGHLEQEKKLQNSTIKAQEDQIKTMEQQIDALQQHLNKVVKEKRTSSVEEKKAPEQMNDNGTENTIRQQERKIAALEDQLRRFSEEKNNAFNQQLAALSSANEAKYKEIMAMDKRLESLRNAQQTTTDMVVYDPSEAQKPSKHVRFASNLDDMEDSYAGTNSSSDTGSSTHSSQYSSDQSSVSAESGEGESASPDEFDFIKVTLSSEESIEVSMTKPHKSSDDSLTTSSSTRSPVPNYQKEYQEAMALIDTLRLQNEKLRKERSVAISDMAQVSDIVASAQGLKQELLLTKEQKQSATLASVKHEKLRQEHAKVLEELKTERQKHNQLMADYDKVAHRNADIEAFENLKKIHSAVVMKMADLGEENDKLTNTLSKMRSEMSSAESNARDLKTELAATKEAYEDLQKDNADANSKLAELSRQQDLLKAKYFESLASGDTFQTRNITKEDDRYNKLRKEYESVTATLRSLQAQHPTNENLRREHTETLNKMEALKTTVLELQEEKASFHETQARVDALERAVEGANKRAASAKKREEKRASHLKDLLTHYKTLESEHEELTAYVRHLQASPESQEMTTIATYQAKIESLERRIKETQQQRDAALEQVAHLELELSRTHLEFREADDARQAREADLKTMLGHYHELQKQVKEMTAAAAAKAVAAAEANKKKEDEMAKADVSQHTSTSLPVFLGDVKEWCPDDEKSVPEDEDLVSEMPEPIVEMTESPALVSSHKTPADEDDTVHRLLTGEQKSFVESSVQTDVYDDWKDARITKLLCELEEAKSKVWASEEKERAAQTQLDTAQRKLATALRESEDAKKRQNAREGNLRDAVALQKKMEKDKETFHAKISDLEQQLEKAKMEIKLREEETKAARKRATGYHNQFKKLQEKYEESQQLVQKHEKRISTILLEHQEPEM